MKHLKTFENYNPLNYKKGDYVLVNLGAVGDYGIKDEPMLLVSNPEENEDEGFTVVGKLLRPFVLNNKNIRNPFDVNNSITLYDFELGKKISKEEAEFYTDTKKYNL